jgi:hypothetical protein
MNGDPKTTAEIRLAEEIVSVLPAGSVARVVSADKDSICYRVRSGAFRLNTVRFRRESLRKLAADPLRDVKVEYMQRDLLASASRRAEYRFPHAVRLTPRRRPELLPHFPHRAASV